MSAEDQNRGRKETRNPSRSYVTCSSKRQREIKEEWDIADQADHRQYAQTEDMCFSESEHDDGRHWRQDRFTPLTKTPKEILAMETVKFKAPPPMTRPAENQNKNKFCEFHKDKGHNTDECIHLRKQIEEAVKSGQLSHLIKEIKQGGNRGEHAKAAKKGETSNK
ncbi:hypothetical protein Tco_0417253 [Tanacetum coccineum]